ncbi:MAG: hypothetical protein IKR57_04570 [Bacilli bacterium]|nr:hypothetical protein [Bacilli bacterium]
MKKLFLLIFSFVILFSFNTLLKAECNNEELNEWATTIKGEYVLNEKSDSLAFPFAYFITINPLRDDVKIKVTDASGVSAFAEKYEGKETNVYGVGCYTNLEKETYKIQVYGNKNSACPNELLRTLEVTVPRYNEMSKAVACKDNKDYELCKTFTDSTENMTEKEFKDKVDEYTRKDVKTDSTLYKILSVMKEYLIYIIIPFVIVTIIYIIRVKNYKTKRGEK